MSKKRKPTKEQIYDAQISPLMVQIIAICKQHKIPVVATFGLGQDDNGDLHCTTVIIPKDFEPSEMLTDLNARIYPETRGPMMITTRDGKGNITSMTAVI